MSDDIISQWESGLLITCGRCCAKFGVVVEFMSPLVLKVTLSRLIDGGIKGSHIDNYD